MSVASDLSAAGSLDPEQEQLVEDLESVGLLSYLKLHPHPSFVLPSPRLSSSSAPSLKPIWINPAAETHLGSSLENCLSESEQRTLTNIIAQRDLAEEETFPTPSEEGTKSTEGVNSTGTGTDGSVMSFFDEAAQSHEISLFKPDWPQHKLFYALVVPSPHPSFVVLHLHPPPKKVVARRGDSSSYRGPFLPPPTLSGTAVSSNNGSGSRRVRRNGGSETGSRTSMTHSTGPSVSTFSGSLGIPPSRREQTIREESGEDARSSKPSEEVIDDDDDEVQRRDMLNADSDEVEVASCTELIATTDWAKTPLGPRSQWPGSLRTALSILLKTPNECLIWWGPDYLTLYNDLHAKAIGDQHPRSFGRPAAEAWGESWKEYKDMAMSVMNDGTALAREDDLIFLNNVETYQSWRWTPLTRGDGSTGGVMINSLDVTRKILKQRWLSTIRDLSTRLASCRSIAQFSENILKTVEQSPEDFSFAYLYHNKDISKATDEGLEISLQLAGTVGVPYLHSSAPQEISLNFQEFDKAHPQIMPDETGIDGTPWPFREAFMTRRMVMVPELTPELADALEHRSWGDPPTSALCIPVSDDWEKGRLAFLVVGLNTRRPFDSDYDDFMQDIQSLLLSSLKGISLFESEARRLKQLEELDRAKTVFFTTISHELKTPLTLIKGPIHDLSKSETATKRKKIFSLAMRNINRLARLVDGLMDFARLEAGRLRGVYRPMDLSAFTADLASSFRSAMELNNITYTIDCEPLPSKDHLVYTDRDFWEKVVFNLIGNSFKYTLSGSITVKTRHGPKGFSFSVEDTGVGIAKKEQDLVFERFHRVEGTARSHEGTGIGLSLTLELVSLSGGHLALASQNSNESKDGKTGSEFTVTLPYGKAHLPVEHVEDTEDVDSAGRTAYGEGILAEAQRWGKGGQSDSASGSASASLSDGGLSASESMGGAAVPLSAFGWVKDKDLVLVVDDSSDMVAYLKSLLGAFCRVITASNGQEGLEQTLQHRPDLIISDLSMPILDGVGFLAEIRNREDTELMPFILLTARSSDEDKVEGLLMGADDYLTKPFSGKELVARSHLQLQLGKKRFQLATRFREQLKTNQLLIDSSPIGIARFSRHGNVELFNDSYYRMTGHPKEAPMNSWSDYISDQSKEAAMEAFRRLQVDTSPFAIELLWTNGCWTFTQIVPLGDVNGHVPSVVMTHTDVTDTKRLQEVSIAHERSRFEEAEKLRKKANEEKRQQEFMISVISHELRNPVSAIIQCVNLVSSNLVFLRNELQSCLEPDPPFVPSATLLNLMDEDLEALDSIHEMALSQERIANDVLSMGKLALNTLEICPIPVDLVAETQKTISTFATECRTKDIDLQLCTGPQLKELIRRKCRIFLADPVRLGQICLNLVSNAIRFTAAAPKRRIVVHVDVRRAPPMDGSCRVPPKDLTDDLLPPDTSYYFYGAVEDTGPGLKPEELDLLFRRFSQASKATHSLSWTSSSFSVFGGSGLGLHISRILTELMGGRIEVESVLGEGSTFRFFIKIATGAIDGDLAKDKPQSMPVFPTPLHILVVEDNVVNQKVLCRQLTKAKLTYDVASNGQEGLDKIVASIMDGVQSFDVVLMDINMPVMNGIEATLKIRELEKSGELPRRTRIVGLTGNAQEDQVKETIQAGMDQTIIKPYKITDVLWTLKKLSTEE